MQFSTPLLDFQSIEGQQLNQKCAGPLSGLLFDNNVIESLQLKGARIRGKGANQLISSLLHNYQNDIVSLKVFE